MGKKHYEKPTIKLWQPNPNAKQPIASKRYQVIGTIGQGTWGTVYAAKDTVADDLVALKILTPTELAREQMQQRGLTENQVTQKEGRQLVAASHVVPRTLEVDDSGQQFIKMPIYARTLADAINDHNPEHRLRVGRGLTLDQAVKFLTGTALGINEMQTRYGQIHPDLSPDNIVLDIQDEPLLTDLGSATVTTSEGEPRARDNMGSMFTRAYECFKAGSRPDRRTNSFALGALAYRLFIGEYPHESGLENAIDPAKYIESLDPIDANSALWRRIKRSVPRPFRSVIFDCLVYNPDLRPKDGEELVKRLNKAVSNSRPETRIKRWGLTAAALAATLTIAGAFWHANSSQHLAQESQEQVKFEKRIQVVRDYLGERRKHTWDGYLSGGEIEGWVSKFKDENTGIAAFLNTDLVREAVEKAGGKTDWESLVPIIRKIDDHFYAEFKTHVDGEYLDAWMWQGREFREKEVDEKWAQAGRRYELKLERENKKTDWGSGTGVSAMFGDLNKYVNQGFPPTILPPTSQSSQPTTNPSEHYNFTGQPPKNP
jgi:serine/threonine protein kinase